MKWGGLTLRILLVLTFVCLPLFSELKAQEVAGGTLPKTLKDAYAARFFSVGQVLGTAHDAAKQVTQEVPAGDDVEVAVNVDGEGFIATETTNQDAEAAEVDTTNEVDAAAETNTSDRISATYDEAAGTITYQDLDGNDVTVNIADIGLSAEWISTLIGLGGELSVVLNEEDGSLKLIVGSDECGAKKWEFDPSSRLVAHYEGEAGNEHCTVVTSDQEHSNYIWGSKDVADPGAGPDGHIVMQQFNYDDQGNLESVNYYAWTAGDRQGKDKARYMYRQDTAVDATANGSDFVSAFETGCENTQVTTKYYNDPFPVDWDPVLTGTVVKDEYGNYWLDTGCKMYLLTCRTDGFDADKDGQSGADEMNSIDWASLEGQEITVRGHEVEADSEGGLYYNGEAADMFSVVDVITPEEKAQMENDGTYETTMQNMEDVAAGVDPVHEQLVADNAVAPLGWVNLFNGGMPTANQLGDEEHIPRLMEGLAPFYLDHIANLDDIRVFATPALDTALTAAEEARQQAEQAADNTEETNAAIDVGEENAAEETENNIIDANAALDDEALAGPEELKNRANNWLDEVHELDPI